MNWLYGAYIPKEAPLVSLTGHQREKLFVRQTFTTPGIYVRSSFLSLIDQASGTHALSFEALHQNVPELPPPQSLALFYIRSRAHNSGNKKAQTGLCQEIVGTFHRFRRLRRVDAAKSLFMRCNIPLPH